MTWSIITGDCREALAALPEGSAQTCVTSPPYWGLRDYGVERQIGLEGDPDAYVGMMISVFREVRRVLRDDGTLWLNLGDSYIGARGGAQGKNSHFASRAACLNGVRERSKNRDAPGLKPKDLVGIPWRVALALQSDGWWLRSDIIWHKPNPMPESVEDRPTKAHEYLFLLAKSERYYYDSGAIKEPGTGRPAGNKNGFARDEQISKGGRGNTAPVPGYERINKRTVWTVPTQPFGGEHFATFPPKLIEPCILAGAPAGGVVLDPFAGAGTTGLVADRLGRDFLGIELNPQYADMARARIRNDAPLLNAGA